MLSPMGIEPLALFIQSQLDELRIASQQRTFRRHEPIYRLDDPASYLYYIVTGSVKITRLSDDGKEKIMSLHRTGEIFGELCFCEIDNCRSDQAVALEQTEVLAIPVEEFLALMRENPKALVDMLSLFCQRLSVAQQQIETLSFDNTTRRLARTLLQAVPDDAPATFKLNLTHEELAHMVGTTREITTTAMNQFRDLGLIDYRRGHITPNRDKLRKFLVSN